MSREMPVGSSDRFGYEWAHYARILPEHERQLSRWMGSTGLASFAGKRVLDVGCGMGRNPFFMLKHGAKEVVAIDIDERSLEAARRNLAPFPNAIVRYGSVYELTPQEFGHFDRVTCIGVLHHLEEPSKALEHMWSVVAEGGDLCLWCYGREGNERILPLIHLARFIGSRLPIEWTHALARAITTIGWPLLQHMSFRIEYFNHLKTLSKENVESIIFDQMIPRIAHYWTREEMEALVKPLRGLIHIEQVQGNSWHVRIEKKQMLV